MKRELTASRRGREVEGARTGGVIETSEVSTRPEEYSVNARTVAVVASTGIAPIALHSDCVDRRKCSASPAISPVIVNTESPAGSSATRTIPPGAGRSGVTLNAGSECCATSGAADSATNAAANAGRCNLFIESDTTTEDVSVPPSLGTSAF